MQIIKSKILSEFPEIVHGISTKIGLNRGEPFFFNTSLTVGDDRETVWGNRKAFFEKLGISNYVLQAQTHSGNVTVVDKSCTLDENDALITNKKNLALCISIADCTPILLFDRMNKVIAGVHSGWRGTEKRILVNTLSRLIYEFNSKPENIYAFIGPSICQKHYEVGKEVAEKFKPKYLLEKNGKYFLDVAGCNLDMLLESGIPSENIEKSELCTYEEDYLHSYRRDRDKSGRMMAVIMIKGENE